MTTIDQPDLGPAVRCVIGGDRLIAAHGSGEVPHGVSHERPAREGRHVMVLRHDGPDQMVAPALAERLIWLDGRAGAPKVIASGRSDDLHESVVIRLGAGAVAMSDPLLPVDPETIARLVGASLRSIHELEVGDCPFGSDIHGWRDLAQQRVVEGGVQVETDGPYARLEPAHLLEILDDLIDTVADVDDAAIIHGLPSAAHTWLVPDGTLVFTGWQKCGIGDRHHDLAVAASALSRRFAEALIPPLLDAYGLDRVDLRRLDLHQLLVHLAGAGR